MHVTIGTKTSKHLFPVSTLRWFLFISDLQCILVGICTQAIYFQSPYFILLNIFLNVMSSDVQRLNLDLSTQLSSFSIFIVQLKFIWMISVGDIALNWIALLKINECIHVTAGEVLVKISGFCRNSKWLVFLNIKLVTYHAVGFQLFYRINRWGDKITESTNCEE